MNNFKSYFVMTYMMMAGGILVIALCQIVFRGLSLTWLGTLFAVVPFLGFFVWTRYVKYTPRSSPHLPILTIITLAGLCLALYGYLQGEVIRDSGFGLAEEFRD